MEFLTILRRAATRLYPHAARTSAIPWISAAALSGALHAAQAQSQAQEYELKAALLTKFGLYVEWPGSAFPSPASPVHLCIAGEDPFGQALDMLAADTLINDRKIISRRLQTVERNSGCHILYLGDTGNQRIEQILDAIRGGGVLTVSEAGSGQEGAGIIEFVIKDNRVRFNIDDEAAAQQGLLISSKLLSLALNVKRRTATTEGR
ncbi:MAG: YfiR family protein [Gammaproteobacteria bacterium]